MLSDGNVRIWGVDLVELNHTGHTIHRDIFARDIPTADPGRSAFTALLSFALIRAPHYVFARDTFGRSRQKSYFCYIDKSRATMFLRLIVATTIVFHEASIYDRCVRAASLCLLPVQVRTSYRRRSRTRSFKANRPTNTRRGFKWAPVSAATPCTVVNPILDARVRRSTLRAGGWIVSHGIIINSPTFLSL